MAKNKTLEAARKAYNRNQQTKGGQRKAKKDRIKTKKKKKKPVSSSWDSVREKTQTAGNKGKENRKSSVSQTKTTIQKASNVAKSNQERSKAKSTTTKPLRPTTGAGNSHRGAASSVNVTNTVTQRRKGIEESKRAREVAGDVIRYAGKDVVATATSFLKSGGKNKAIEPDYKGFGQSLKNAADGKKTGSYKTVKTAPKGASVNQRTGTWETKTNWKKMSEIADKAVASAEKEIQDATKNISDKKNIEVGDFGFVNNLIGMQSTKDAKKEASKSIEKELKKNKLTLTDAVKEISEFSAYGDQQGWTDDTMLTNGMTWGETKKSAGKDILRNYYGARRAAYDGFRDVGKVSKRDLAQLGIKGGVAMAEILAPYIGTAGKFLKGVDALSTGSKAMTAVEGGSRVLSKAGKEAVENTVRAGIKNGNPLKGLEDVSKAVAKSDFRANVKREILANALQDATIGTGIDYLSTQKQGLTGKDAWKYMGESAVMNAVLGTPIAGIAGRTGKAGKAALNTEINSIANQTIKAVTEENRLARRLGAKGLSPEEIQKTISKKEVQDWINLSVKEGKSGLTVEQQKHLDRLSAKIEAQKKAYNDAINESVKLTRESIGKASAIDVARLRRAVIHYDMTGQTAMAKEARTLLKQAMKNLDGTLDTVTKAAANVGDAIKRDFKVESAEECITAFGKTGGKVNDPSQFHGFVELDKDGNIVAYHVNSESEQALEYIFGHEFMHGFESLGKQYEDFVNDLKTFVGEEWDKAVDIAKRDYADVKNADFEKEAVANLVAKHFFSEDGAYLKKLAGENPTLFAKVYEAIKKLLKGTSEHDAQFEALSKRMDEMLATLSTKNQEIIKGSPDYTELMFTGEGSARAYGDKSLLIELDKAKEELEQAVKEYGDSVDKMAQIRKNIFKEHGWFEGLDGKWRYEISDAAISWKKSPVIKTLAEDVKGNDLINIDEKTGKYVVNNERAATHLQELEALREKKKLTKKEQGRIDTLESKLRMYELFTNGLPIGEVINHPAFFKLYPEALKTDGGGIRVKLDTEMKDAEPAFLDTETKKWDIKRKVWINTGADESVLHLNANFFNTKSSFYDKVSKKYGGSKVDKEMKASILHELQHYVQEKEGFSRGADTSYYRNPSLDKFSEDNIYPKNFEKDADKLNQLNKAKLKYEDALWMIDGGEADAFMTAYRKIKNLGYPNKYKENPEIEERLKSGDKKEYVEFVYKELRNKYKIKIPSKEFRNNLQQYLYKDFSAGQIAERNPKTLYDQTAGEIEAFKTEERLWSGIPDEKNPDTHGRRTTMEERLDDYPVDVGQNVRFKEYPTSKGTTKGADIDSKMPNRRTRNEDGLVRRIVDYDEKPKTERFQTTSESEASYYDRLASEVESAEKELQEAMDAYNPADNKPVKGQMTDEVRAQVKAQNLDGKELTDAQVDTLAEAQVALHNTKVVIPESARTGTVKEIRSRFGIAEDNMMLPIVKSPTAKNAQSVADGYAALSKEFPDLFPSSITDEAEQFRRLMDVSGLKGGAQSRRGNYYVPKNRTMTPYKPKPKSNVTQKTAKNVAKADKVNTEAVEASKKITEAQKPKEQPKVEQPKETPVEKNGMIERDRRENTKKRENETAKRAFKTLNKEYEGEKGWVDAVTGKREGGAFGKLKIKGAKEAEKTAKGELANGGYDKLKQAYFVSDFSDDPNLMMARANELLGEINRKVKAGDGNESELFDEACDIMEKYTGITSLGGNILNAAKKFMTSTPQGRKRVVYKEIERLEKRYKDRIKDGKIIPPEDKIEELVNATGAKADDLLDEINKEIWEQIPASLMERMNEYRHCFMLFNIKTHGRNVLGNSVFRMARAFSDDMERRILNSKPARNRIAKMTGQDPSEVIINRQRVTHKELKDNYMYLFNEFHAVYDKSGSRNKYIETGRPDGVDTVKFKAMQKVIDFNYKWLEKEDLKGALIPAFNKSYYGYCKARCISELKKADPKFDPRKVTSEDVRKYMENMTNAQKDKARQYALMQGEYATFRDSCALSDFLTAKKTQFAGQKGKTKWGTFGYRALDAVLEGALPFVKTPVNIFRRAVDYSPASLVMSLGKLAKADSPEMFQLGVHQLCTGLTGTGMAAVGVFLAQHGLITVKVGEESGDAYYDRDMGYQDYSIQMNTDKANKVINKGADFLGLDIHLGDGKTYSWTLDWMSPMNMSLFMGAAFEKGYGDSFRAMFDSLVGKSDKGALKAFADEMDNTSALNAFFAITSPMTDMSFMSSPKDTMERFLENATRSTDGKETDFAGALAQLILGDVPKNYVSGFFPQVMSQLAGATDEYRRDTKSTRENIYLRGWESSYRQIVNKIPWAREYLLNPKVNRRGEDVKNDENIATRLLNSFINPANVREITMDEQDREIINIRNHMDKTSDKYRTFYYNFTGNPPYDLANGKRMTYKESHDYAQTCRKEMNIDIKNMLDADSYKDMTWDMKAEEVDGTYWIGKAMADKETYGFNYAMKILKDGKKSEKRDYNTWKTYKENAGEDANKDTYWNYYIEKERLYNRSHPVGNTTYRVKGLPAIQSGDQALIDAVGLKAQEEPELKHYWEIVKKKFGKKAKDQSNKEISDGVCMISTNLTKAGIESETLGMLSASAGKSAKGGKQMEERVYRALGQFWDSAQAGGGLMLKYNDASGKYDLKNLEKLGKQLDKKLDNRPDGVSQKDVVCDFIENDLGITNADEAACVYQVLYLQGHSNPASKTRWKNPYADSIKDWLKWGENRDDEWGGLTKGSGGGGHGWGRRGRRRGHGGSGGSGGGATFTPVVSEATKVTNPNNVDYSFTKAKVTNPFGTSNTSRKSNLDDAYRKRAKKLRRQISK